MDRFRFRLWDNDNEVYDYIDFRDLSRINETLTTYEDYFYDGYFERNQDCIEQCTGLKDKNGNLIYEGDIVKIPADWDEYGWMAGEEREVYFCDGGFRFKPNKHTFHKNCRGHWMEDVDGVLEIIGNIHEQKDNK